MKFRITLLSLIVSTLFVSGQEKTPERKGGFEGKNPAGMEMHHLRFAKHILSERCIKEAQINPDQVRRLKHEFEIIDKRMYDLGKEIGETSRQQAEVAVKVLTTPGSDPHEMIHMTEKIGNLRTEQAKLSVKVLLVIRDTLEPHQCAKVVELMKEEREKMRRRMEFMRDKMQNRRGGPREEEFNGRHAPDDMPPPGQQPAPNLLLEP